MDDAVTHGVYARDSEKQQLSSLLLAKYRFYAQAAEHITLPEFKGSVFHGGFGHALKATLPSVFDYLFQPPFKGDPPRPYVITPPLDKLTSYPAGHSFYFDLLLIGPAIQHAPICFAAFEKLGSELGIRREDAKFKITQIDFFNPQNELHTIYKENHWQFLNATINAQQLSQTNTENITQLSLTFPSYLRLKDNAKLVNKAPSFRLLMDRLLGRICTISKYYTEDSTLILNRNQREKLLTKAEDVTAIYSTLKWQDWTRYSGRQKTQMKFGGLTGAIQYRGEITPFMPYLKIGQWLHVGGKTSFGLGKYSIE